MTNLVAAAAGPGAATLRPPRPPGSARRGLYRTKGAISATLHVVRIVLCDDDSAVRMLFRAALDLTACSIVEAVGAADCRRLLATEVPPDLVILDVLLRDGTAFDLLPEIRRQWPDCRIVVVSAHTGLDVLHDCLAAGADACVDKLDFLPRIDEIVGGLVPTT